MTNPSRELRDANPTPNPTPNPAQPSPPPDPSPARPGPSEQPPPRRGLTGPMLGVSTTHQPPTSPEDPDLDGPEQDGPTRSDAEPPRPPADVKASRRALRRLARDLVSGASRIVNSRLSTPEEGLWLADDDDQSAIGDPLANAAARRGVDIGTGDSDLADLIGVVVGLAVYLLKNFTESAQRRRAARTIDLSPIIEHGSEQ